ncbi:MAG: ATP-binding protein, partial [Actinomadura sp.]
LINDILDLSKVEAGRMDIRPKYLPLAKLLDYVNATFRPIAVDHGLDFDIEVSEDAPHDLYSDEQRLQQILRNLLSNAFKFTSEGHVRLHVERATDLDDESLSAAGDVIGFTVEDTGIGIPHGKLTTIFEAFEQAHGPSGHAYSGTGLGLSISRELAGLLGGKIVAESELGRGSSFTLFVPVVRPLQVEVGEPRPSGDETAFATVPVETAPTRSPSLAAPPDGAALAPPAERAEQPGRAAPSRQKRADDRVAQVLSGAQVLIVDDDTRIVTALTHVLGRAGVSVLHAGNGEEGIEVLRQNPDVSLVLMDIMMPVMDGYETMKAIRSDPRYADLPIVALTAKAIAGEREKAIGGGANEYLQKPADVDHLLGVACDLLDPEGAADGSADSPPGGDPADES